MNRARSKSTTPVRHRKPGHSHAMETAVRTTITLSPAAHEIVERFKNANGTSTSAAIDEIIQRSEPKPSRLRKVNGLLVLSDPPSNPDDLFHITVEEFKDLEDRMDREAMERVLKGNRGTVRGARKNEAGR